jgi:IclR family transcriptional regulator, mhp operon transcriptional activator
MAMVIKVENRSLDRAITVLEVLARGAPSSLHQLHERTGLPKSTIRRLLGTLKKRHFVRQGVSDDLYRINIALPWAADREYAATAARLIEVARPHMVRLTSTVEWPSDLGIYKAGRIVRIESTQSLSPLNMDKLKYEDREVNIFGTANGLAYLSALDDAQVLQIIESLRDDPQWALPRVGIDERTLLRELKDFRARGYAFRRKQHRTTSVSWLHDSIAVPIYDGARAIGALSIKWLRRYMPTDRFARKFAGQLKVAATAISADLTRLP